MSRPAVALTVNSLGLGGIQKGLVAHARELDPTRFQVHVVGLQELGPSAEALRIAGIRVDCADGDAQRLAGLIAGADVVHAFRAGAADPLVLDAAARAGTPVLVETNVFGLIDPSRAARGFDCRLFVSRMCALRYRDRAGPKGAEFHRRHRVLPHAVDVEGLRAGAPERSAAKQRLGLDPARPVVARIGRADDLKWRTLLVDMLPTLLELAPDAQPLLVGVTPAKRARLERRGVLDRCTLLDPVADDEEVACMFAACDVMVNAAELGEAGAVAITEAMALGIPVVTCSTPWVDNAQVELVEHGVTGLVANHPQPFAEAVAKLLEDERLRVRLGAAAQAVAERSFDARPLTRQLEALYESLLAGGDAPDAWEPSTADLEAFAREYPRRVRAEFRPLSRRERAEARAARERERAVRLRGLLRPGRLRLALALARARLKHPRRR
jgi:glycosyltransferase involved in cell wall biosynthesis